MELDQKTVAVASKKPGRPFGFSPKKAAQANSTVLVFTTDAGEVVSLKLKDAERIAEQVTRIKAKLG